MGFQARIKQKRDTSANWTSNNPVILDGEIILVDTADGELRAKIGDGVKTYTQLPFSDEALRSLINNKVDKVSGKGLSTNDYTTDEKNKLSGIADGANKTIVDSELSTTSTNPVQNKVIAAALAAMASPAPWAFSYNSAGDVLGFERDVSSRTVTDSVTPYNVKSSVAMTDSSNAYNNTENTACALMETSTAARTVAMYIDMEIPTDKSISSMSVSFKVGTSNISAAVWTTHNYTVKCGGNTLGSGDFGLSTGGRVVTVTVTDMSKVTSPIIEILLTVVTTATQNLKIYGAQVDITYTSSKEFVSILRQNMLAVGTHTHGKYATTAYVDSTVGFDP